MRCSRCAKEIPDGSVFCGLCGAKQIALGQTLVGTAERLHRAQTLLGGPATGDVMGGGRRFAALSAAPQSAPPPDSTPPDSAPPPGPADTLAEGVPTGAMAGLLAARSSTPSTPTPSTPTPSTPTPSTPTPSPEPDLKSTLLGAPALTRAQIDAARLGDATEKAMPALRVTHPLGTRSGPEETTPNQPSITPSSPPAEAAPNVEAPSLEPQAEPEQTAEVPPPKRQVEVRSSTRPAHVEPTEQPSVIVDSTFDREAQRAESVPPQSADTAATTPRVQASGAPAAQPEPKPEPDSTRKASKRGFSETAWFLDALDADALSRAETEDIRDRQERFAHSAPDLDPDMRRQLSLRTQDQPALRIERADDPARTLPDRSADRPPARRNDAVIGLVLVVIIALGALGWWWFTQ